MARKAKKGCKHKNRFPIARGSLWAKWDWFCTDCGVCPSDPSVAPRPDLAKQERERNAQMEAHLAKLDAMTPEEKKAWQLEVDEGLKKRLEELEEQLRPFKPPHNCLRP